MRLFYSPIPNYIHAVEAVVNYAGLGKRITPVATNPFDPASTLWKMNPLGTVPTLVTKKGEAIYGGPVIYAYLDTLHKKPKLFPKGIDAHRVLWLADGVFDTFVKIGREANEPRDSHRAAYVARNWEKIGRALDQLNRDAKNWKGRLDIGQVRTRCSLAFIDRFMAQMATMIDGVDGTYDWRKGRPALKRWFDRWAKDPIFSTPLLPAA